MGEKFCKKCGRQILEGSLKEHIENKDVSNTYYEKRTWCKCKNKDDYVIF